MVLGVIVDFKFFSLTMDSLILFISTKSMNEKFSIEYSWDPGIDNLVSSSVLPWTLMLIWFVGPLILISPSRKPFPKKISFTL